MIKYNNSHSHTRSSTTYLPTCPPNSLSLPRVCRLIGGLDGWMDIAWIVRPLLRNGILPGLVGRSVVGISVQTKGIDKMTSLQRKCLSDWDFVLLFQFGSHLIINTGQEEEAPLGPLTWPVTAEQVRACSIRGPFFGLPKDKHRGYLKWTTVTRPQPADGHHHSR